MIQYIRNRLSALSCMTIAALAVSTASAGTLQGTAAYRERMMLPPDAVFEAQLQDVARADAPARVVGRARLDPAGQPPFRFRIDYDDAAITPRGRYTVRGAVTHQGRLLYTTDRMHPVLDGRDAPLELMLVPVRRDPPAPRPADPLGRLPASFEGEFAGTGGTVRWHVDLFREGRFQLRTTDTGRPVPDAHDVIGRWTREPDGGRIVLRGGREAPVVLQPVDGGAALRRIDLPGSPADRASGDRLARRTQFSPIEPRLLLAGMFVHLADAPSIVLCADLRSVPVAMEADFRALEAAYATARAKPGERVLVSLQGLLATRPSMEPGQPARTTLVVERFVGAWPGQRCGSAAARAPRSPAALGPR